MIHKLEAIMDRYEELSASISEPDVIRNFSLYQQYLKERASLEPIVHTFQAYQKMLEQINDARELLNDPELGAEADAEMVQLGRERDRLLEELKVLLVPPDPRDDRNVILEIRAGAGGEEAALFAGDLMRMYLKYADRNQLQASILSLSDTDLGGVNEALLMVSGQGAFARMKYESGVHCVKRVPVTESGGRIHTSTVTVAVMPEAEEVELIIDPSELKIDVFHASGHGGQGVNTTDSAVRVTHVPTGMVVSCQDERSQLENKNKAIRVLRSRLLDQMKSNQESAYAANRKAQVGSGDRSERISTYYFNHDYVVDHRIGMTIQRTANFLNGDLNGLIEALRMAEKTEKINRMNQKDYL